MNSTGVDGYVGGRVNTRYRTTDLLAGRLSVNPIFEAGVLYNKGAAESLIKGRTCVVVV